MPPLADRILHFLPTAGLIMLVTAVTTLAARRILRRAVGTPRSAAIMRVLLARPNGGWEIAGWVLFCTTLLLGLDSRGFTGGFFRQDDFSFLQVVRESGSLSQQLLLYHNDHTLPLFRFEIWALASLAGLQCTPTTLAAWFNAANFLTYLAVLLSSVWLLAEMGARRVVLAATCALLWLWPCWGEFTAGFYTLWMYPQSLAFGLSAMAAWLRASRFGDVRWVGLSFFLVAVVAALGVVGLWIFPAMAVVIWLHRIPRHNLLSTGALVALGLIAFAFYTRLSEHPYSERERVQNPSAARVHARILPMLREHAVAFPLGFLASGGGAVLTSVAPPVLKGLIPQVVKHPRVVFALIAVECLVAFGLLALLWRASRHWSAEDRRRFVTLLLPFLVLTGMTIVARPALMQWPALFWPAKYQCIPFASCVLAAGFALECTGFKSAEQARTSLRRLALALPLAVGLTVAIGSFESALHLDIPSFPGGRDANVRFAQTRRADYAHFMTDLTDFAAAVGQTSLTLPELANVQSPYPFLEIGGDATTGANYIVPDLLAASPASPLSLTLTELNKVDTGTLAHLRAYPLLTRLFIPQHPAPASP